MVNIMDQRNNNPTNSSKIFFTFLLLLICHSYVKAQKELGDITIHYTVRYKKDSTLVNAFKTVYIHGNQVRTDFFYDQYLQTIIDDDNTGMVQILKEVQNNKYKTMLDSSQWVKCNDIYKNAKTTMIDDEEPVILLGYRCGKALLTLMDGNKYLLYYTLDVTPSIKENKYQFANIPGIVLRYESADDNNSQPIEIHAKSINLMPISSHIFNTPSKGYKILKNFNF